MPTRYQLANAIRALTIDAIQRAKSGHPGMPLGMADIAEVLWNDFLNHNPKNPKWLNRDRFVLSNGHGSMLLYAILHLSGYDLTIEDIKSFRQFDSKTPGHPEVNHTPGVETTTGPLGQGLANAIGMAVAEKILASQFNRPNFEIIDHCTYVFLGDGCLMEGISHEVCSLAGNWGLGKLIAFWDNNGISIDGKVDAWFSDDTVKRFKSYNWHVISGIDGHDPESIHEAITRARAERDKPSLICCKTVIGFGSPNKSGTADIHGAPLGEDEIAKTKKFLDWSYSPFEIPDDIYSTWNASVKGKLLEDSWNEEFNFYKKQYPQLAEELLRRISGCLPSSWDKEILIKQTLENNEKIATRKASQKTLELIGRKLPELLGGSSDLTKSNLTAWSNCRPFSKSQADANYIYYGVREFGMSAIMNGISLYGGFIPYGGTFLVFSSYAINAVRMAALMQQRVIFIYTHDSIGVGEDGPTHQPIEQIAALRVIPNLSVWRPCDFVETMVAWQMAVERNTGPTALLLSRQSLPIQDYSKIDLFNTGRGAYILKDCCKTPEAIIIATGSEVHLAISAAEQLSKQDKHIRVVSMPSEDTFMKQDKVYRENVLPSNITKRLAIEAGSTSTWHKWVMDNDYIIGIDCFGKSAPGKEVFAYFDFTVNKIVNKLQQLLEKPIVSYILDKDRN